MLIDLWRSDASLPRKLIWPFLLVPLSLLLRARIVWFGPYVQLFAGYHVILSAVAFPAYWFIEVREKAALILPETEQLAKISTEEPDDWRIWGKRSIAPFGALCYFAFLPRLSIEALQECVGKIASLWLFALPALLFGVVLCFSLNRSRWSAVLWTFLSAPLISFILLAASMFMRPTGGGPDGGFVGMGTMFVLLLSLPIVIPGVLLLGACPRKEAWAHLPWAACIIATVLPFVGVQWGIRHATALIIASESVLPSHVPQPPPCYGFAEKTIPPFPEKPAESEVRPPQPGAEFVWINGAYRWLGRVWGEKERGVVAKYQWEPGHWEKPPEGKHTYVPGHWQEQKDGYNNEDGPLKNCYIFWYGCWK